MFIFGQNLFFSPFRQICRLGYSFFQCIMDYIELLNAISYSRLLWATKEQLVNHIGDKRLKEHSMKEEFDTVFMQRAVYKSLADEIENKSNGRINLAAIIENYKTASAFFNEKMGIRYFTNSKDKKQHIFDMLLYVYGNHHIPDEVKGKLREVLSGIYDNDNKIQKVNAAILFLLLIHSLPTYNSKHDATDIEKDFSNAIGYLKEWEMSDCAPIYKYEAFIGEASKQDKRNVANFKRIPLLNRAMLIAMMQEIFDYIDVMLHIYISKKYIELRQKTLYFPKIDGLWCRDKTCKTPPFYYIKRLSNVYLVFKCELQNGELVRKRQELYLYSQAELLPDMLMPINTEDSKRKNVQYCHANIIPNDYIKAGCELNNKEDATIDDKTQNYFCELHQKNNVPQKIVLKLIDQYGVHNDKTEFKRLIQEMHIVQRNRI